MGIAKSQFNEILKGIFKEGNTIKLFSTMPDEATESGEKIIGQSYKILSGDFSTSTGSAQSAKNMMMYLCETAGGDGTAVGFGVYNNSSLLYFGRFSTPMNIAYNTVPTIKKYNGAGEGVLITMTSTDVSV